MQLLLASAGVSVSEMTEEGVQAWMKATAADAASEEQAAMILSLTLSDFRLVDERRWRQDVRTAPPHIRRLLFVDERRATLRHSGRERPLLGSLIGAVGVLSALHVLAGSPHAPAPAHQADLPGGLMTTPNQPNLT